ncbi:MAG: UDP-N-acetylglucosamine 2-epimerase (non-hydrolyzing) [bacterium]|nr:UDP-N-acetylglucosamine 2-epimerase (non-hydrolyzing) [bacterium]
MLVFILGTRPEIIKCSPVIHEARRRGVPFSIVHTGQHYSPDLDSVFFEELGLPLPSHNIHVGSLPPAKQIAAMLNGLYDVLLELQPSVVMVQGDTNTVLGGALTAHKMGIKVAHLEAGLRSDDWDMPEEANRVLTGFVADYHFCPTEVQRKRLEGETITEGVHVVGNSVVDASFHYSEEARKRSNILERLHLHDRPFALLTMHRPSNVDDPDRLALMLDVIAKASQKCGLHVVFPIHPRTLAIIKKNGIIFEDTFVTMDPIGYLDLLCLQLSSQIVLTDSGGIQEEACILHVPSITLRSTTERPETLHVGASALFHIPDQEQLVRLMRSQMKSNRDWENPFGDGKTAERVMDILQEGLR